MIKTIQRLIEVCTERENGYKTAAHYIRDHEAAEILENLAIQSKSFKGELISFVSTAKSDSEEHPLEDAFDNWMDFKSEITDSDPQDLIAFCEAGEKKAIAVYEEALENMLTDRHIVIAQTQLSQMKNALEMLNELKPNGQKDQIAKKPLGKE